MAGTLVSLLPNEERSIQRATKRQKLVADEWRDATGGNATQCGTFFHMLVYLISACRESSNKTTQPLNVCLCVLSECLSVSLCVCLCACVQLINQERCSHIYTKKFFVSKKNSIEMLADSVFCLLSNHLMPLLFLY